MIKIYDKYEIPSTWEELSTQQYIKIISAILEYDAQKIDFQSLKTKIVLISVADSVAISVAELDPSNDILCENIYRLSELLTYPYRYVYEDKRYKSLSPQVQQLLEKRLPGEIDSDEAELRIAQDFTASVVIDLNFAKQLIPHIDKAKGYTFSRVNAIINTSLTASQYIEANTLCSLYFREGSDKEQILNSLLSVLYSEAAIHTDYSTKVAVLYNYLAICEWISKLGKYDLLFNRADGKRSSSPLGATETLCDLSEKGYGDYQHVCDMNLFTYLDILLKQTLDAVRQMDAYKIKHDEIASKLNLSVEQVINILS